MATTDPRIDAYIDGVAPFAQPILRHIRALVHDACSNAGETMKWSVPHFVYKDKNLASMAAFKGHASLNFWHGDITEARREQGGMGKYGKLTAVADLPPENELRDQIAKSIALIDSGGKAPWVEKRKVREALPMVPEFQAAIDTDAAAMAVWAGFTPGKVRDYLEWIGDAKTPATRDKRIAEAVGWIAEGKDRNWKYRR